VGHRRGGRKLALDILYEHEISSRPVEEVFERYSANPGFEFASKLVRGVIEHLDELDALISKSAIDWEIDRMPLIDKNLLRMSAFELLHSEDVPGAVAIDEALELAKIYSTEDSSRFINGVLGRIAKSRSD